VGVYCDECLSTGEITVEGVAAVEIERLRADLAAALAHIDAVPVNALRRWRENSSAVVDTSGYYDDYAAWRDCDAISYWLDGNEDDGSPPAGTGVGPADVRNAAARAGFIDALIAARSAAVARAEAAEAKLAAVPVDALRRFVQMGAIVRVPRSDEQELEFERLAEICEAWADSADELAMGTHFPMPVRELTELMDAIANCRGFPFGFERERETILRWLQQESEVQS
jgi:hypothetical protein